MHPPPPQPPPGAGDGGGLSIEVLPGGGGLRLAGEADRASLGRLRAALAGLPAGEVVQLDLARLRFIDVAGTRELMAITQTTPPRRLVLLDPPLPMRRIISLLWPAGQVDIQVRTHADAAGGERPQPHRPLLNATSPQGWPRRAFRGILGRSAPPK